MSNANLIKAARAKNDDFEVWFDDSKGATREELDKMPPLSPEKQRELDRRMEQLFKKYLKELADD